MSFVGRVFPRHWVFCSLLLSFLLLGLTPDVGASPVATYSTNISALINPQKLATLGKRGTNPRLQKTMYWLATAQQQGVDITNLVTTAVTRAGYTNVLAAQLTSASLLRNLQIAAGYGCLDEAGLADMRKGQSPTIQRGQTYRGDQLSVDHIVPRAVCPELDNVIANLELMPLRRNSSKRDKVETRQVQQAQALHRAGLLSKSGLRSVQAAQQ